jgi:2-oxoisovalerate dehydrogenase E1 component
MTTAVVTQDRPLQFKTEFDLDRKHAHHLLHEMLRIRRFEEKCVEVYGAGKIRGFMHLYDGEEAIAVGVMQALAPEDAVVATYREHGQALARGMSPGAIMAEMYGKQEGCSRGRGGSMHLFDAETRFYGGNGIVGGGIPLAVGIALADKLRGLNRVTCCFFGDGAVAEGEFHESMNLAALWNLPVLFICENNAYCMGTAIEYAHSETDLAKKAAAYRIAAEPVDGMDILATRAAAQRAVAAIRAGEGPQFLECRTYRFRAHSMFDAELYRDKEEVREWRKRDPITTFAKLLMDEGLLTEEEMAEMQRQVDAEVQEAVDFAEAGTLEPLEDLMRFVHSEDMPPEATYLLPLPEDPATETREITYREAVREAMSEAIRRDERVFLIGADVGRYGGCFAVSKGMLETFGPERIIDTPLSESAYTGAGIGAAMNGMLPIVEVMTVNFSLLASDQIINNAATVLHMSGGQFNVPVVIRMGTGGGKRLAAQHSNSLEGLYARVPGLKVLTPATVEDARGMLETALADPDPVLIFENTLLYNMKGELPLNAGPVGIDKAKVHRAGNDISIFTYSISLFKALEAAEILAQEGIDCEVVDLRTLRPLDTETIIASVAKTHRALVVDEGWCSGSIAAEVSARIMEQAFYDLDAPVARLCGAEVPLPYAGHLEDSAIPQVETIVEAVRKVVKNG